MSANHPGGRIHKILVVEDNSAIRNVTCEFLAMMGFHVIEAEDGQKAFDMITKEDFDLIITDLMMPVMNGEELIHNVRRTIGLDLPIILVSGSDFDGIELLANSYTRALQKPYAFQTLMNSIGAFEYLTDNA
jgi:DNA-binding response OmpR family regulator